MIAVRVMKMPINQVVYVVPMRYRFVAAPGPMHVPMSVRPTTVLARTAIGVSRRYFDRMLIDMITVHVVQMPLMQVIHVPAVMHSGMPTVGSVNV
jgi:hypothetical protein